MAGLGTVPRYPLFCCILRLVGTARGSLLQSKLLALQQCPPGCAFVVTSRLPTSILSQSPTPCHLPSVSDLTILTCFLATLETSDTVLFLDPYRSTEGNFHHSLDGQRGGKRLCSCFCCCCCCTPVFTGSTASRKGDHTALLEPLGCLVRPQSWLRQHRRQNRHLEGQI